MKLSLPQKVLLSMGVVAGLGVLAGAGTFATFTAQTTNPDNVFANGTLVLSNEVDSLGACLSTGAGTDTDDNENEACDTVFDLAVRAPGDSDTTNVTLKNMGSLAASNLVVFSGLCTDSDATGENYNGDGSPCSKIQIYIQKWSNSARTVPADCLYGGETVANTCDFSNAAKTLATFVSDHTNLGEGLSAGGLAALGGADTAWFTIGVKLPADADNTFQGRAATLDLNWHITQV